MDTHNSWRVCAERTGCGERALIVILNCRDAEPDGVRGDGRPVCTGRDDERVLGRFRT